MPVHLRIEPSKGIELPSLRVLWRYREVMFFLSWRDVKVRYKQTVLGISWAVLQPLLAMVVFSIFFGRLGGIPSDDSPYPVFVYAALLPWQWFSHSLSQAGTSLVANRHLLTKVYFPRLIIPISTVLVGLVDFAVSALVFLVLLAFYGVHPTWALLTLPVLMAFAGLAALSVSIWLAALNVEYRDTRHALPFVTQLWLFATPVAYPTSLVPDHWRLWYAINPMVGVVDAFRWAFLGGTSQFGATILMSVLVVVTLLIGGLAYFARMENTFADVV